MGQKLKNVMTALSDTKTRSILITILFLLIIAIIVGVIHLKRLQTTTGGVEPSASLQGVPYVRAIPTVGTPPTSEYAKLQEKENVQVAATALRKETASIVTPIRTTYLETGVGTEKASGCSVEELRRARASGVTASELRCRGCSLAALKAAGYTAGELKDAGFSAKELKDAGFSAADLRNAGFSAKDLKDAGFSAADLKAAGFSAAQLKDAGFSAAELKAAGFSAKDLKDAGFSAADLKADGFSSAEIAAAGAMAPGKAKDCSVENLRKLRGQGISSQDLKNLGCDVAALKAAGFTAAELKAAGFSAKQLKDGGFSAAELKDAGFSAKDLKDAGFSAKDLKDAGFSAKDLKDAGFTAGELKAAGFSAKDLKDAGFSAKDLKNAGFGAADLKDAGFSAQDLKDAGFTNGDLIRAGFNPDEVNPPPAVKKDCSIEHLKELHNQALSPSDIKNLGCSLSALKEAGFTAAELKAAGYSAKELKDAGFSAKDLKDAGFSADDLKSAGFSAKDLKAAGFSDAELKKAGFAPEDLAEASTTRVVPVVPVETKPDWEKELEKIRAQQAKTLSAQEYDVQVKKAQQTMTTQANDLFASWIPLPQQQYVPLGSEGGGAEAGGLAEGGAAGAAGATGQQQQAALPGSVIKAGTIMFAILETGINSDVKSPVLATVVQGPLKGSRLMGDFERMSKNVVLRFTLLNKPDLISSVPINAVAIDPNTAKTALADHIDNHYMLRYGALFAASFLSGVGQAVQNSGDSVSINTSTGENVNFHGTTNILKSATIGLGEVGNTFSQVLRPLVNTPPTVEVRGGSGIGLLLMEDLRLPVTGTQQ